MKFTDREVTNDEYQMILADFRDIEKEYGIIEAKSERINVTVEESAK